MKATAIGDLAQTFVLQQRSAELRNTMQRLSQEMTTGRVQDITTHLGGDFARLSDFEHRMVLMDGLRVANAEAAGFTQAAQTRLGRLATTAGEIGNALLALGASPVASVGRASIDGVKQAFEDTVEQLNASYAGRALFAGIATDAVPLADPGVILDELRTAAAGAASSADALARIEAWFADPAGFATLAYHGATTDLQPLTIGEGRSLSYELRADDPVIRNTLRDLATAVLATDPALGLSATDQAATLSNAGEALLVAQDGLIGLSAGLGVSQEQIELAMVRQQTERFALESARNSLISADPFETATELEAVQFQLESLYAITVRSSQLNLVNFLR